MTRPYHHGSLRSTLLEAAIEAVTASGPANLSMRELARRAGVSYAASAYHFGDKAGLLTALAAQGYDLLADALDAARQRTGEFVEVGVAYVRFAVDHRAHFEVMYPTRPAAHRRSDPRPSPATGRIRPVRGRRRTHRGAVRGRPPHRGARGVVHRARLRVTTRERNPGRRRRRRTGRHRTQDRRPPVPPILTPPRARCTPANRAIVSQAGSTVRCREIRTMRISRTPSSTCTVPSGTNPCFR